MKQRDLNFRVFRKKQQNASIFNANWIIMVGIVSNHLILLVLLYYSAFYAGVESKFVTAAFITGFLQTLGITAGYHRLWSHNAYNGTVTLKIILQCLGSASWQGSIRWWVLRHRMHHRFTDTKYDPYDSSRGLWFSHFGWLFKPVLFYEKAATIDMSDLSRDPVVEWNRKYYPHQVIVLGLIFPAIVGLFMGSAMSGFLWIGVVGRCISWNSIFFVNSLAHYWGEKNFDVLQSATSNLVIALLANGEGWHQYHHSFPHDYRHGICWWHWDPTKWCIQMWSYLGLANKLVVADAHLVQECKMRTKIEKMKEKLATTEDKLKEHLSSSNSTFPSSLPLPNQTIPSYTLKQLMAIYSNQYYSKQLCTNSPSAGKSCWIIVDGYILDVTSFMQQHPGGQALLRAYHMRDASEAVHHGRNKHTYAACLAMKRLRIAKIINELSSSETEVVEYDISSESDEDMSLIKTWL